MEWWWFFFDSWFMLHDERVFRMKKASSLIHSKKCWFFLLGWSSIFFSSEHDILLIACDWRLLVAISVLFFFSKGFILRNLCAVCFKNNNSEMNCVTRKCHDFYWIDQIKHADFKEYFFFFFFGAPNLSVLSLVSLIYFFVVELYFSLILTPNMRCRTWIE